MQHYPDFSTASSEGVAVALGERLEQIRLRHNLSQVELATAAGVSRSTITRLGVPDKGISLDSFIRILQALKLTEQLQALLPDPSVLSPGRVKFAGAERRRASHRTTRKRSGAWGDETDPV